VPSVISIFTDHKTLSEGILQRPLHSPNQSPFRVSFACAGGAPQSMGQLPGWSPVHRVESCQSRSNGCGPRAPQMRARLAPGSPPMRTRVLQT
jgi:hypothetical protein